MVQWKMAATARGAVRRGQDAGSRVLARLIARGEEGVVMVEYAMVIALIAVVAMVAVGALGNGIAGVFTRILSAIQGIG